MAISTDFLEHLEKFHLIVNKNITSSFIGERESTVAGSGLSFADYTRYTFGDDFRRIDWRVYARTDKLYVKRYEEDRNLTVQVIVDFSASMNFGSKIKKSDYAAMIALGFCYVALKNNEKFVLSTFSERLARFRPRRGVKQLAATLHYLNTKKPKGKTNFENSLVRHKGLVNTKSMIVVVSDFFYDLDEIRNVLFRFRGNKIVFIQVLDKQEKNLDLEGDYEFVDLESDESMKAYVDPRLKNQYFNKLQYHNDQIRKACDSAGADFYTADTGQDIFEVFYNVLR